MMEVMQYEKYREMLSKLCKLDKCGDDLIIIKLNCNSKSDTGGKDKEHQSVKGFSHEAK